MLTLGAKVHKSQFVLGRAVVGLPVSDGRADKLAIAAGKVRHHRHRRLSLLTFVNELLQQVGDAVEGGGDMKERLIRMFHTRIHLSFGGS